MDVLPQFKGLWIQEREDLQRIEAQLFVPLMVREELIGILVLGPKRSDTIYSVDERRTLITLANQGAVAIDNAHLFALEQRKAAESSALLDIAEAMSSTLDLNRLLKIVGRRTAEVCGVDRCSMLLLDEEAGKLIPLMSQFGHGAGDPGLWETFSERTYTQPIDQVPLVQRMLSERQPVVFHGDSLSRLPSSWIEPFAIKSLLVVPLISKDRASGLMVLDHSEEGRGFDDEQVNLATMIGSQVSIAIESARLYEETIEEKERTETIVEQAFAGIMVVDSATRIVAMNPEAEAISGYGARELLGKRLMDIFEPELWAEESLLAQVMATGERVAPVEAHLVGRNHSRDILLGVTRIGEDYLLNFSDITDLKEVDRLKSSIVANVSHEFRAPLASIKAYTELLLDDLEGEDRALRHRFLSVIDGEADRLTELITDLLDLSRFESRQFEAQMDLLSIAEIVEGVIARPDVQLLNSEVTVDSDIAADLPPILADKELIEVLVKNLVSNAVKFSTEGGRVEVKVRKVGDDLVLQVADWGMGIPPEDLPHLFTKFFRSGSAKESGIRGTGLGLVLAKEAADIHGGVIDVESELGTGTRFTVTLPIERETRAEGRP
jgi:PAS domain S-box-containing protein